VKTRIVLDAFDRRERLPVRIADFRHRRDFPGAPNSECRDQSQKPLSVTVRLSAMLCHRRVIYRKCNILITSHLPLRTARFHRTAFQRQKTHDPRLADVEDVIRDQFAVLREDYKAPKHPIILAHGLLGFDELHLAGQNLPGVRYWYGITEALAGRGIEVITATVPPSGSIEDRAAKLADTIARKADGKAVNIIA
jgi:triacylglycerol lipase